VKQIAPHIYEWSQYQAGSHLDAHGHFIHAASGERGLLLDPVAFQPGDEEHLHRLGGVAAVLLTSPERVAAAATCRDTLACPVLVPRALHRQVIATGLESAEVLDREHSLPTGLHVISMLEDAALEQQHGSDVLALYHGPSSTAILGNSVVGAPAGSLSLAADEDRGHAPAASGATPERGQAARIARSLRQLLGRPVARVLVGLGQPVLREAEQALQDLVHRHDPAAFLVRQSELVWQTPREKGSRFSRSSAEYSRLLGLGVLDFELTVVPPGKQNTLVHRHAGHEELFIVLEGEGEALTEHGAFPIRAGDALGFPARYQVAHAIRNTGNADLRLLSFGADTPAEPVGLAEYPNSGKQLQRLGPGRRRSFYLPENLGVDYWEGERTE
jgi:uncharacterized cupin superfamily protein